MTFPMAASVLFFILPLPQHTDSLQTCARKALCGYYGPLKDWQRDAYELVIRKGITVDRYFVLTQYNGQEPDGKVDARGVKCTVRVAASNKLPRYVYIWTAASGVRQVLDCGSHRNDVIVRRLIRERGWPEDAVWVDIWWPTAAEARRKGFDGWKLYAGAVIR